MKRPGRLRSAAEERLARGAELRCVACGADVQTSAMDRHLWCEGCVAAAARTANRAGWLTGGVMAAALALWIVVVQQPSRMLAGGWVGVVIAAWWLTGRASREVARGVLRYRGRIR